MKVWHKKKRMEAEERKYPCPNKNAGSTERRTDGRTVSSRGEGRRGDEEEEEDRTARQRREKGTSLKKIEPRARVGERENREQAAYAT